MRKSKSSIALTLATAAIAFTGVFASSASAAEFILSETGTLSGTQTSDHVFTTNGTSGGTVTCKKAAMSGTITSTEWIRQDYTVNYSHCSGFGFAHAYVSPAEYTLDANGTVDLTNTITISIPLGFCSVTIAPQAGLKTITYTNHHPRMEASKALSGLTYTSSGGFCGTFDTNGTYTGSSLIERVGGGSYGWSG